MMDFEDYLEDTDDLDMSYEDRVDEARMNMSNEYKSNHAFYLQSAQWKKVRSVVLNRDNNKCVKCGSAATEVHHKHYNLLGCDGEEESCISICRGCHQKEHGFK
jgi:hypothetical protein